MKKRDRTRPRPDNLTPRDIEIRNRIRAATLKWQGKPPGIPASLVQKFEDRLDKGRTVKDLTSPPSKWFMVPHSRFRTHCDMNPEWGERIRKVSVTNTNKKKALVGAARMANQQMCLKGLHPMKGDNVMETWGKYSGRKFGRHRRCRACYDVRRKSGGKPIAAKMVERIKDAILGGASFNQICHGIPIGGGPRDPSLYLVKAEKLQQLRRLDPDFDAFVTKHFAVSNSIGQMLRHAGELPPELKPTLIAVARLKHRIKGTRAT